MISKRLFSSSQNLIGFAFAMTVLLVSILVFTADRISSVTLNQTAATLQDQYQKMYHLMQLQRAGQQRTIDIERILLHTDPFAQDEALMNLYANGRDYMAHRAQLKKLVAQTPFEKQWLTELNNMAKKTGPIQESIAQLAINGEPDQAENLLFAQVISETGRYNQKFSEFLDYQTDAVQSTIEESRAHIDHLMNTVILLATLLIVISTLFSVFMARHLSRINRQLAQHNQTLEQEVQHRTQDLVQTQTHLLHQNQMLERLSNTDPLTEVCNRLKTESTLERLHERFCQQNTPYCLLLIDLDHFKSVNDTFGHHTGDEVLKAFAELLKQHFTHGEHLGRWGGEEFIVIVEGEHLEKSAESAEALIKLIEQHEFPKIRHLTVSAGLACIQEEESNSELIHRADTALYESKHAGRNRLTVNTPQSNRFTRQIIQ